MISLLLSTAALATGLPPMDAVTVVDAACRPTREVSDRLAITYDRVTGVCAPPGPDVDPCHYWDTAHLPADDLTVFRQGCATPLPGGFEPAGMCGERPLWLWTGRLDPGHPHTIGPDGGPALTGFTVVGPTTAAACLPESPLTDAVSTPVTTSEPSAPQWIAFPADGYAVAGDGGTARLQWTPGPRLQQWVGGDPSATLRSDPLPEAEARAVLAAVIAGPTGVEVRHQVAAHREHFEGFRRRGVPFCERVLAIDLEQRLRTSLPETPLGPVLRHTVVQRSPASPDRCGF